MSYPGCLPVNRLPHLKSNLFLNFKTNKISRAYISKIGSQYTLSLTLKFPGRNYGKQIPDSFWKFQALK